MSIKTCGLCKHWHRKGLDLKLGTCRRFPPTPVLIPGPQPGTVSMQSVFPPSETGTPACGEFRLSSGEDDQIEERQEREIRELKEKVRRLGDDRDNRGIELNL